MNDAITAALIASIAPALFFIYTVARDWWDRQPHLRLEAFERNDAIYFICTNLGKYPVSVEHPKIASPLPEGEKPTLSWLEDSPDRSLPYTVLAPGESRQIRGFLPSDYKVPVTEFSLRLSNGQTKKKKVKKRD